ncbi:MAG: DUF6261 family protein [Tannerella sp.]|jgi:hypothetical protein|nr:DUF6261 family protein [Tannerella sp.]
MLIIEVHLHRFRNEAHYEFMFNVVELMTRFPAIETLVVICLEELNRLLPVEKAMLDRQRKSALTLRLEEADQRVDRTIVGINNLVRGMLHHPSPDIAELARQLDIRMKDFGRIVQKAYEEEAAAVQELIDLLTGPFSQHVATLGLTVWVETLQQAEAEFVQLYRERNTELANRPEGPMRDLRKLVDVQYHAAVRRVEAYIDLNGGQDCMEFVRELNDNIKYFNEHTHHRTRHDIAHAFVQEIHAQPYTGKPVIPIPTVFFAEGGKQAVELAFPVDFTVTYKDNVEIGTASLLIHGKGAYKGSKTVTFNIGL